jgi:lysophospholipase L1-like esterase
MMEKNCFGRLFFILFLAWIACAGLYRLPDRILGFEIKKTDMLSEIRRLADNVPAADTLLLPRQAFIPFIPDSSYLHNADSLMLVRRDSLYLSMLAEMEADTAGRRIRDFSAGHTGLRRFFDSLRRIGTMSRPVRIAFLGDSFIEGDILVADFRSMMQARFGGRGVGFVPIASHVEQYRPTVRGHSKGWTTHSILSDRAYVKYVLSGLSFEAGDEASLSFRTTDNYPGLESVSSVKFIYSRNSQAEVQLTCNGAKDTFQDVLPATTGDIMQYEAMGNFTDGHFRFRRAEGLQALGYAMEDNTGIVVDNFSLRGNTGIVWANLDERTCRAWNEIRPYDLIILQYGLNVASENVNSYTWYSEKMEKAIHRLQQCFPDSDILLLSVSDRSHYRDNAYRTMPAIVALWNAQYKMAMLARIPFWSVFHAMGGEDGMARYVKNHWASKDYTHLSFRGGREIAEALYEALILEKELYDEVEEILD